MLTGSNISYFAVAGVRAVVLEVDKERHRLSLGLKASYFADVEEPAQQQEVGPNLGLHTWVLQAAHASSAAGC